MSFRGYLRAILGRLSAKAAGGGGRGPRPGGLLAVVRMPEQLESRCLLSASPGDPGGALVGGGSSGDPVVASSTTVTAVTYTITWRWNENLVLSEFHPAVDVLALDWFTGAEVTLGEEAGSAVLAIPSMQQSYRLLNVPLTALSMANFTCKDSSAATAIAGVLARAATPTQPPDPTPTPTPTPTPVPPPTPPSTGGVNSGNPGDARWGEAYFAPYVDMGMWPVPNLVDIARTRGVSLVTLGFVQATPDGAAAWAGLPALAPVSTNEQAVAINQSIRGLQAAGGDVMVSFGGAAGTSLAEWYATHNRTASELAQAYAGIVDAYSLNRVDFDIEGAAVANAAAIALGSDALRILQQLRPGLEVWYTLPVLPQGLTADGLAVVRAALRAGVILDGVNVMAMDYGEAAAPTTGAAAKSMAAYAVQAATSTQAQLASVFAEFGLGFGWNQLGVTPMIGVNDVLSEVFTVADAQGVEDFARQKGLGMLAMWSVARDTPGTLGQATSTASGLGDPAGSFSSVFRDYGTQNTIVAASPTPTPTPTPTPGPSPSSKPNRNARAGDTNIDWSVDILDVANFLAGGKFDSGESSTWGEGDFGGDGLVDILDAADFVATGLFDRGAYHDPTAATTIATTDKVLAAYFPEWGIYGRTFQIADVPGDRLNHLIYAFLDLKSNGQVAIYDSYAAVEKRFAANESVSGEADLWYYPPSDPRSTQTVWGNFNQIAQLKQKFPHLRVSIAVGGWTLSANFSSVCSTAAGREAFASSLTTFLATYRMFDGIDFDWEYPGGGGLGGNGSSPNDGANYAALLQLVRQKFDVLGQQLGRRYGISVASPAGTDKIATFNLAGLTPFVDHFNLMAYDFHGTWEGTTGHQAAFTADATGYDVRTAVHAYRAAGVPAGKVVLGAPLYTRAWSGVADGGDGGYGEPAAGKAPGTFEAGVYDYKDLLAQVQSAAAGWRLYWDDTAQAAYVYNAGQRLFSSFETPTSIAQKSQWAQDIGLGGMMFWDISNDALDSPESLVTAGFASWVLGDDLAAIRGRSTLTGEVIVGGDGLISALPPTS
ncbi:MAG: glycosyl hydrolase family 18 protein [Planctomycetaceae bacterium]